MTQLDTAHGLDPIVPDVADQGVDPAAAASRIGRRRLLAGAGAIAGLSVVGNVVGSSPAGASGLPVGAGNFHILPAAVRLADTRRPTKYPYTQVTDRLIRVKVGGANGVPATASAAVLTVTAVNFGVLNHVTVWPTGQALPTASNLNMMPNAVTANMVTVKLGTNGHIDVTGNTPCHLIVDVLGYYEPVAGDVSEGRFVSQPGGPRRVYDSRPVMPGNESYTVVDVTAVIPPDASAVVINLTAAAATAPGHFTAMAYDAVGPPSTSSLNVSAPGENRAAGVVVPVRTIDGKRRIKIYAHRSAFIIVDVFGWYTGSSTTPGVSGLFVPMTPQRLKDTRKPGEIGRMWPHWVVEVALPSSIRATAAAVACNVTGVLSRGPGHLTVSAARRPIPNTSNVNWVTAGAIVPNHVITTVTNDHGLQVYNYSGGHVIVDLAGYFTGTPQIPSVAQYVNPPPPAAPPEWTLTVPGIGLVSRVLPGDPSITNWGHSWHWTGTGYMGQAAHVAVFGHRTDAGGPYRYINLLNPGDTATVVTGDRREFTYRMVRMDLVAGADRNGPPVANILAATRLHPGTTLSMVACSKSYYPYPATSLNHRLVVTFELVSWREI